MNLTYYGLFVATAETFAIAVSTVLLTAAGASAGVTVALITLVLSVCAPAARWIARAVDGKRYNFSVAGAAAVGMVAVPLSTAIINALGYPLAAATAFGAISTGYVLGEGIGRLACISFGCCYGKPLSQTSPWIRTLFRRLHFVFHGATKKIAYESNMDGVAVVPVQAVTCCAHVIAGLISMLMFLECFIIPAFMLSSVASYAWRIYSETLRADHRGKGRVSKYQVIAAVGIVYTMAAAFVVSKPEIHPKLSQGLGALWDPFVIVYLQVTWCVLFVYHGRSMVTGSEISFYIQRDRV